MPFLEGASKFVLLVKDDPDSRDKLAQALQQQGHTVCTVSNGLVALDYLRTEQLPDVILLDLKMPVMDGTEFRCAQLQDPRPARLPVVMLTGPSETTTQPDVLGDVGYLQKPVDPQELAKAIQHFAQPRKPEILVVEG